MVSPNAARSEIIAPIPFAVHDEEAVILRAATPADVPRCRGWPPTLSWPVGHMYRTEDLSRISDASLSETAMAAALADPANAFSWRMKMARCWPIAGWAVAGAAARPRAPCD